MLNEYSPFQEIYLIENLSSGKLEAINPVPSALKDKAMIMTTINPRSTMIFLRLKSPDITD